MQKPPCQPLFALVLVTKLSSGAEQCRPETLTDAIQSSGQGTEQYVHRPAPILTDRQHPIDSVVANRLRHRNLL